MIQCSDREQVLKTAEDNRWKQGDVIGRHMQFHRDGHRVSVTFGHRGGIVKAYWGAPCGNPAGIVRSDDLNKFGEVRSWLRAKEEDDG